MPYKKHMLRPSYIFTCLCALALSATIAHAATTPWQAVQGGSVRLITAGAPDGPNHRLGLEFSLDPGWHTYWRFPGEAGIPPSLDFSGSKNVKQTDVLFPVPERYSDGFSTSIVYHDTVVLPIDVTAAQADQPVQLNLSIFFGICSNICVPGDATFSLELGPDDAADSLSERLINRDLALVPQHQSAATPHVNDVTQTVAGKDGKLRISAAVDSSGTDIDLFAEGPEGSFIALPKLVERGKDTATWELSAKGLQFSGKTGDLHLVLVVDGAGYESRHELKAADFR